MGETGKTGLVGFFEATIKCCAVNKSFVFLFSRALFSKGEMTANTRVMSLLTCLLQGPSDCGHAMLGLKGVLETMVAMTGADEEEAQVGESML